ncbi:hypothetical protein D9O29_23910, partial [Pantoea vagans]
MSKRADRSNLEEERDDLSTDLMGLGERGRVLSGVGDLLATISSSSTSTGGLARGGLISSETGRISSMYVGDKALHRLMN